MSIEHTARTSAGEGDYECCPIPETITSSR